VNITIIGRKCTPRESFKARAEEKLLKVEKFFGGVNRKEKIADFLAAHPEESLK
jgi:hypothetical protein